MFHREGMRYCAISDEGFRIERSGSPMTQFVLNYIEGAQVLVYPLENLIPGSVTPITVEFIDRWSPPFSDELIPYKKKEQIAERIVAALEFLGDSAKVIRK